MRVFTVASLALVLNLPVYSQQSSSKSASTCLQDAHNAAGTLTCAESDAFTGNYKNAIEEFKAVLNKTDTTADQRAEATAGIVRAAAGLGHWHEGFLEMFWGRILAFLLKYLVPLLVIISVVLIRVLVNVCPRRGILVSLSDLDAESSAAAASSRSLTAELLFLMEDPEPLSIRGLKMNTMPGTDQPAFGVVRPAQAMTQAPDFSSSKQPVKLGAVEFGLDDLARVIGRFFGRPSEGNLVGWLSCSQDSAVAAAELKRRGFRIGSRRPQYSWRATAIGEHAREEVLANIAAQILVDMRDNRFTDTWQSLKACQDGINVLRADGGIFDSSKARRFFAAALEYDSANWIARFYLALSLCGEDDGKPATALRHFEILEQVLRRAELEPAFQDRAKVKLAELHHQRFRRFFLARRARIRAFFRSRRDRGAESLRLTGLLQHLVNYPECPFILQYNIAIAVEELRRKSGDQELRQTYSGGGLRWDDPLSSLEKIAALRDPRGSWSGEYSGYVKLLGEREKLELSLYAQSARAHIMSLRDPSGSVNAIKELLKDIEDTCCQAREQTRCFELRIASWRAIETTRAVTLASLARALATDERLNANQEARDRLYEAIASEPHLVDAYLQLAKLYMRWQDKLAINWKERAASLLAFAHEMNPTCDGTNALRSELDEMVAAKGKESLNKTAAA